MCIRDRPWRRADRALELAISTARGSSRGRLFFMGGGRAQCISRLRVPGLLAYCIPVMSNQRRSSSRDRVRSPGGASSPRPAMAPALAPIETAPSFKHKAYAALKNAIVAMDIYRNRDDIRLDERKLAHDFGVSRTPVREAMAQLESEGFVRSVPRRGIYVVRKTKREVIEMITAWAPPCFPAPPKQ